ncbi:MAG: HDOD domain-containing protein [Desulfovibrionaceae bacterium]
MASRNLPTLPTVLEEAMELMESKKANMTQVAAIIGRDQVLTTKLLKMVNSALYGFPGRIASIQNAVALLGMNVVKGLIISTVAMDYMLKHQSLLREHSIACSTAAREVAIHLRLPGLEDFITAGLLHDFGKVIITTQLPEQCAEISTLMYASTMTAKEAETAVLGFSHEQVSAWLANLWHLPAQLTAAMQYHHAPLQAEAHTTLACGVHLANFFAHLFDRAASENKTISRLDGFALKHLGIRQRVFECLLDKLGEKLLPRVNVR